MPRPVRTISARPRLGSRCAILGLAALLLPSACAPKAELRTTLLRASDIESFSADAVQQLASSPFIAARGPDATRIVLQPQPMRNLSDNRLSQGDQWAAMSKVLFSNPMLALLASKNIDLQMPAIETTRLARAGLTRAEPPATIPPTHAFTATLRSIARADDAKARDPGATGARAGGRKDTFLVEYAIIDLASRRVEWTGQSTLARIAHGSLID